MTLKINPVSFKSNPPQALPPYMFMPSQDKQPPQKNNDCSKIIAGLSFAGVIGLSVVTVSQRKTIKNLQKALAESVQKANENITQTVSESQQQLEEKIIPYTVKKFEETSLYKTFQESKQNFIDFLSGVHQPEKVKEFLFGITSDEKAGADFIKEVTDNPRESFKNTKILMNAIGGEKNLLDWLHAPAGYNAAYEKYLTKVINKPETTLNDLINISPNWHLFKLMDKTSPIVNGQKTFSFENVRFGEIPKEIEELGDFNHFVNWLFERPAAEVVEYSGKYMKVHPLKAGMSGKAPLKVQFCTPDGKSLNHSYIIKKEPVPAGQNNHINQAYHSDSVFLNAQIDYYLSRHNCENAPRFYYYDCPSNTAVYEFIEGEPYTGTTNIIEINKAMKDLNSLGIFYNDCKSHGNILMQDGLMKIIDSGESYFHDILRPPCENLHVELPNWCGNRIENLTLNKLFGDV